MNIIGTVFACGCRVSNDGYYPCPYHEGMINADWCKMDGDEKYMTFIIHKNQEIWKTRMILRSRKVKKRGKGFHKEHIQFNKR